MAHSWMILLAAEGPGMENELSRVVDALPAFVWTAHPDGQIDFLNQRWTEFTGLSLDRSYGRGWQTAIHPQDVSRLLEAWQRSPVNGAPVATEVRVRRSDGDHRWFLFCAHALSDASGQIVKWCGLSTDIEQQKRAEESLRDSELSLRSVIDGIPGFVGVLAPNGQVEAVNRQIVEYCGRPLEELKNWGTNGTVHEEDLPHVA